MERSPENERLAEDLALIADGDRGAMARLYASTSPRLYAVCLRILGDRATAEDVLQEIYITAWTKAGLYDRGKSSPLTWLITIARNRAIDHLRVASGRPTWPLADADLVVDPTGDPEAVEVEQSWVRLMQCLDRLEPRQASAIRAAFMEGVKYEILAEREGVPSATLKSWVRRGLLKLRKLRADWE